MTRVWSEEMIAAYVDGSLEGAEAEAARRAIETDPEAQALARRLEALSGLLSEAFPLPAASEMPPGIAAALEGGAEVVPFRRPAAPRPEWRAAAVAACLALVAGLGAGLMVPRSGPDGIAVAGAELAGVLETVPSGASGPGGIRPLLTFRDAAGRPCREFEIGEDAAHRAGIACRTPEGGWDVAAMVAVGELAPTASGAWTPASGPGAGALEATLDALGAGLPLGPGEEAELLSAGWR